MVREETERGIRKRLIYKCLKRKKIHSIEYLIDNSFSSYKADKIEQEARSILLQSLRHGGKSIDISRTFNK